MIDLSVTSEFFIYVLDLFGTMAFVIIGATFTFNLFGLNFLAILLAGMLTAVGGGILRDIFVNQVPIVFVKEFYALLVLLESLCSI